MKVIKGTRKNLEIKAAQLIATKIRLLAKTQKYVTLAIPGGSSVTGIFSNLKNQNIPWTKVHIFMVDERLVPTSHPDSNYRLAKDSFLDYLTEQYILPKENLHPFSYNDFPKQQAIKSYKNELREISHRYDVILLSSGPDGHIASLFPNHETIKNQADYFVITENSPKPPPKRISASRKLLQRSLTSLLLFFGENKQQAYRNFCNTDFSVIDCPAKLVNSIEDSYVLTDLK